MPDEARSPDTLLDRVRDRDSFIEFVEALAAQRQEADRIERTSPNAYRVDGALGWKNADIAGFLRAGFRYFETTPFHDPEVIPSWKMFAEFLYFGKIIE